MKKHKNTIPNPRPIPKPRRRIIYNPNKKYDYTVFDCTGRPNFKGGRSTGTPVFNNFDKKSQLEILNYLFPIGCKVFGTWKQGKDDGIFEVTGYKTLLDHKGDFTSFNLIVDRGIFDRKDNKTMHPGWFEFSEEWTRQAKIDNLLNKTTPTPAPKEYDWKKDPEGYGGPKPNVYDVIYIVGVIIVLLVTYPFRALKKLIYGDGQ